MRIIFVCLSTFLALAACAGQQAEAVDASPPTVSYNVTGNDTTSANAQAAEYCRPYGMVAELQGIQPSGSRQLARYICVSHSGASGPQAGTIYGSTAPSPGIECADWMHQGRPGGTDYHGPPVPGCPAK